MAPEIALKFLGGGQREADSEFWGGGACLRLPLVSLLPAIEVTYIVPSFCKIFIQNKFTLLFLFRVSDSLGTVNTILVTTTSTHSQQYAIIAYSRLK